MTRGVMSLEEWIQTSWRGGVWSEGTRDKDNSLVVIDGRRGVKQTHTHKQTHARTFLPTLSVTLSSWSLQPCPQKHQLPQWGG